MSDHHRPRNPAVIRVQGSKPIPPAASSPLPVARPKPVVQSSPQPAPAVQVPTPDWSFLKARQARALAVAPKLDLLGKDINRCNGGDPVMIPKIEWLRDKDYSIGPGWSPVYELAKDGVTKNWLKPHVRCICGTWTGIGLHHVHADGSVTASFFDAAAETWQANGKTYHKEPGCGWHVYIKLDGYSGGDFPPEIR